MWCKCGDNILESLWKTYEIHLCFVLDRTQKLLCTDGILVCTEWCMWRISESTCRVYCCSTVGSTRIPFVLFRIAAGRLELWHGRSATTVIDGYITNVCVWISMQPQNLNAHCTIRVQLSWPLVFVFHIFLLLYFRSAYFSPPWMFSPMDILSDYRIQHGTIGPLCHI